MLFTLQCVTLARLIDLHSGTSPVSAGHTWGPLLACGCQPPSPRHAIDDSYSLMKLYSSFLSRAALTRWTLTIHPLSGTHLFPLLLRVLTSHLLPERLLSATEGWTLIATACEKQAWMNSTLQYSLLFFTSQGPLHILLNTPAARDETLHLF